MNIDDGGLLEIRGKIILIGGEDLQNFRQFSKLSSSKLRMVK